MRAFHLSLAVVLLGALAPAIDARRCDAADPWAQAAQERSARVIELIGRAQGELATRDVAATGPALVRAEALLTEALALAPEDARVWALLGETRAASGRDEAAVDAFVRARDRVSDPHEEARLSARLGRLQAARGALTSALPEFQRAIRLGAPGPLVMAEAAAVATGVGQAPEAIQHAHEAVRRAQRLPVGSERAVLLALSEHALALALAVDDRLPAAREAVMGALNVDPTARLLASSGADERAALIFVAPGARDLALGLTLDAQGLAGQARAAYERAALAGDAATVGRTARALALRPSGPDARRAPRSEAPPDNPGLRVVAAATVTTSGALPAPLVDSAWRATPDLLGPCLRDAKRPPTETTRFRVELAFGSKGNVATVRTEGLPGDAELQTCIAERIKARVHLPWIARRGAHATVEVVLAPAPTPVR